MLCGSGAFFTWHIQPSQNNTVSEDGVGAKRLHIFILACALCGVGMTALLHPSLAAAERDADARVFTRSTALHAQTMPLLGSYALGVGVGGGEVLVRDGVALAYDGGFSSGADVAVPNGGAISLYTVEEGDTLSQVAELFSVSVNTIVWANDLRNGEDIQPGETLLILPVSGVRYTVEEGDTLASIAEKYNGDAEEIYLFNRLASKELAVGTELTIPGGEEHMAPVAPVERASVARTGSTSAPQSNYFVHPLPGSVKTQGPHGYAGNALDFGAPEGTPIRAAASGTVIVSKSGGWNGGYGSYVVIDHPNGTQTLYSHLSQNNVWLGQQVSQGETIGLVGNTGRSTGPHLHFEVRGTSNPF